MQHLFFCFSFLLIFFFQIKEGVCDPVQVISRYGQSRYKEGFSNLEYVNPKAPKGGTLVLGALGTFDSVNKDTVMGTVAYGVDWTFDPLLKRIKGEPFTQIGLVAEKVEIAKDYSSVTFYIHPKARFHDGSPITVEDLLFTIQLLKEEGLPRYKHYYSRITKTEVKSDRVVTFHLQKDDKGQYDPEMPMILGVIRILSKKILQNKSFSKMGLKPVLGSGPYRITRVDPGRSITYERVKDYWAADLPMQKGENNFDRIIVHYYKNATALKQAFLAGEFDFYYVADPKEWHTGFNVPAVKQGKIVKLAFSHTCPTSVLTILYNMRKPIFQDIRVRKALALAFDFETLNRLYHYNDIEKAHSLFSHTILAHRGRPEGLELEILKPYRDRVPEDIFEKEFEIPATKGDGNQRQNLRQADDLLIQAGWTIQKGRRVNKKGEALKLHFLIKDERLKKLGEHFQNSLKKLGIDLIIEFKHTVEYEQIVLDRGFDMIVHTWANSLSPGIEQTYYFSAQTASQKGSSNYAGISNAVVEELAYRVFLAKTQEEHQACARALDRVVMGHYFMIPLGFHKTTRLLYWKDRIAFPPPLPHVGFDIVSSGWSVAENKKS